MNAAAAGSLNVWFYRQMAVWASLFRRDDVSLEYWQRIAALRPRDANVLATIANRHAARGEKQQAIAALERAVGLDAQCGWAWFNLGFLRQEIGEHEAAIAAFDCALQADPKLDRAWYGKALSLIRVGRAEDSIEPLKKNIELQPFSPYGYYQLASVHRRLGHDERAIALIRRLSKFEPKVALQLERELGLDAGIEDPYQPGRRK